MVEETSTLTGSSWSVSSQYLWAGGGCSSMLIRQKITTMNDEYHHSDIVGMYPVLTDASANVLRSYVFDAYAVLQSQQQFIGESYPVQSTHTGTCLTDMSEPGMSSSPNSRAVSFQARALIVTSKKSSNANQCSSSTILPYPPNQTRRLVYPPTNNTSIIECITSCFIQYVMPTSTLSKLQGCLKHCGVLTWNIGKNCTITIGIKHLPFTHGSEIYGQCKFTW